MRKFALLVAAASALVVAVPAGTVTATPPDGVMIEIDTTLGEFGGTGPFTAIGPAIDNGLFCPTGFSFDIFGKAAGGNDQGINFQVIKVLDCDDESGAIAMKLQVRIDQKGNNYSWTIVEGFGEYEDLHGAGKGFGISDSDPNLITDIIYGGLHSD